MSRRQLEAYGVSRGQIGGWIRDGRLFPVFHTVYSLGHPSIGAGGRMRAAALACPGALISHRSAAYLLGFGEVAPRVVDLIPAQQGGRKIDGIKAHRVLYPDRSERWHVRGIPCTSPARTIIDLAGTYGDDDLRETVERGGDGAAARPGGGRRDPCLRAEAARGSLPSRRPRRLATRRRDR